MGNIPAGKNSLGCAFIGLVMIFFFSLPASATPVLDIQVTESIDLTKEFNGTTLTTQSSAGTGTITITNDASEDLYDVSLNFSTGTTDNATWQTEDSNVILEKHTGYVIASINPLVAAESVTITYSCSGSEPISFEESYEQSRILVGDSTNVSLTLNNTASTAISGIELVKTASDVNDNSVFDFTFSNPEVNDGTVSVADGVITWTGLSLDAGSAATLNFTATDSDPGAHQNAESLSAVEHYMGNATLQFTIDDEDISGSGVTLNEDPTATTSNFEISLQKNQLDQSEGGDGGGDDWGFTPVVSNPYPADTISYTISAVNLYVTSSEDLVTQIDSTNDSPSGHISGSETWTGDEWCVLNFPEPVPVGWIDVDLSVDLSEESEQLSRSYSTVNGTYELIEKIYIINGYLVEAKKSIAKNATNADQYDITLWVHNKGNLATPPVVVVYDIVPENFSVVYWEADPGDNHTSVNSPIQGMACWWNVGPLQPNNESGIDDEATIHYTVEGTGLYRMTDLFILGIDPSYTLNMQSTPVLRTGARITSSSGVKSVVNMLMMVSLLLGMVGLKKKRRNR